MRLPSYNIPRVMKLRQKIIEGITLEYHGYAHIAEAYEVLVSHISTLLPRVDRDVIWESLRTYAGVPLLEPQIDEIAWRLAGNIDRLQDGVPVHPWSSLLYDAWVPVQVQAVHRYRISRKKKKDEPPKVEGAEERRVSGRGAFRMRLIVLAGHPAGHVFEKKMTDASTYFIRADIGFSQYTPDPTDIYHEPMKCYPLADVTELTRMRFLIWLDHELCANGLDFTKVACTGSMRAHNRKLMKIRQREGYKCPLNLLAGDMPCYNCPKGYDSCKAACHRLTYIQKPCIICNRPNAYHDPERPGTVCAECLSQQLVESS